MLPNHMNQKKKVPQSKIQTHIKSEDTSIILISDLHLTPESPQTILHFNNFITSLENVDSLYILGDLFEYWLGDDAAYSLGHVPVEKTLRLLSVKGITVYLIRGNRDFLIDNDFALRTGIKILNDPTLHSFFGHQVLLLHGDSLCTDDKKHQKFRSIVDETEWRLTFLRKSISERDSIAKSIRFRSDIEKRYKPSGIMDVNQLAVDAALQSTPARLLIHGHTHRPGIHQWNLNGESLARVVLGEWSEGPSWIQFSASRIELHYEDKVKCLEYGQV